jgi:hypothetical protein
MKRSLTGFLIVLLAGACTALGPAVTPRDLARDEAMGGHTLARHVGRTGAQLQQRLEREREISAASTYTDRDTAERVVAETLAQSASRVREWTARRGRHPNLAIHYKNPDGRPVGTSLERGDSQARPCAGAVVVLRWDERRNDYFVLTSYPEVRR